MAHTSCLELISRDTDDLIARALNQLLHGRNGVLVTRVDSEQNTLDSLALIRFWLLRFLTAVGRQAQELGQNKELGIKRVLGVSFGFAERLLLSLLKCFGPFCLLGRRPSLVLFVDLLVLNKLLLVLS